MSVTRRRFLQQTAAGSAAFVAVGRLTGCGNPVDPAPLVHGAVNDDPTDATGYGTVRLTLSDLVLVGGAVTVQLAPLDPPDRLRPFKLPPDGRLLVVHRGQIGVDDSYIAVDSSCPHAYSPANDAIECPCHSSTFRAKVDGARTCVGEVTHGPARQDVSAYQIMLADDLQTVVVDLKVVNGCDTVRLPAIVGGKLTVA